MRKFIVSIVVMAMIVTSFIVAPFAPTAKAATSLGYNLDSLTDPDGIDVRYVFTDAIRRRDYLVANITITNSTGSNVTINNGEITFTLKYYEG